MALALDSKIIGLANAQTQEQNLIEGSNRKTREMKSTHHHTDTNLRLQNHFTLFSPSHVPTCLVTVCKLLHHNRSNDYYYYDQGRLHIPKTMQFPLPAL